MPGAIIASVTPLIPLAAGVVALVAGSIVLRSFGTRYRVGRLLSSVPVIPLAEAAALAAGPARYVAVRGRIDADEPFEDENQRPLVFRRTRLQHHDGSDWLTFDDRRDAVPFTVREGQVAIGVDADALDEGLVVVVREALGTAADIPDGLPPGIAPSAPVRMRIEQLSSVEHAIVLGVPRDTGAGPVITAGLGRPLVLTTLEPPEAMRVLAQGANGRPIAAALLLGAGLSLLTVALAWAVLEALA